MRLMDTLAHGAFEIALEAGNAGPQLLAERLQALVDLGQCDGAVLGRVPLAEHVEVDAVQHEDVHCLVLG